MTMVSSGPISLGGNATTGGLNQSINIELGQSATATISLNDSNVRTLLGKASGAISLSDAYGKANQFAFTISSNQTNANLRTLAVNAGWNQSTKVVATIGSGVIISSNSTGTPALTVNGSFPSGVELINSGVIVGMGGAGGRGASSQLFPNANGQPGAAGGLALSVSVAVSINNAGTIAGGGGGGGGGGNFDDKAGGTAPGGGGGGGRSSAAANSAGAAAVPSINGWPAGNPGGNGTYSSAGGGGAGVSRPGRVSGAGGSGGGWGASGATGGTANVPFYPPGAGGSGGGAVSGNSNITWIAFGTRNGSIT